MEGPGGDHAQELSLRALVKSTTLNTLQSFCCVPEAAELMKSTSSLKAQRVDKDHIDRMTVSNSVTKQNFLLRKIATSLIARVRCGRALLMAAFWLQTVAIPTVMIIDFERTTADNLVLGMLFVSMLVITSLSTPWLSWMNTEKLQSCIRDKVLQAELPKLHLWTSPRITKAAIPDLGASIDPHRSRYGADHIKIMLSRHELPAIFVAVCTLLSSVYPTLVFPPGSLPILVDPGIALACNATAIIMGQTAPEWVLPDRGVWRYVRKIHFDHVYIGLAMMSGVLTPTVFFAYVRCDRVSQQAKLHNLSFVMMATFRSTNTALLAACALVQMISHFSMLALAVRFESSGHFKAKLHATCPDTDSPISYIYVASGVVIMLIQAYGQLDFLRHLRRLHKCKLHVRIRK